MNIDLVVYVTPLLKVVLTILASILAKVLYHVLNDVAEWVESKIGSTNYKAALDVAEGLYIYLEDKYGDTIEKMGAQKKYEMELMLLEKFPRLSQVELDAINKTVWSAFNESWVVEKNGAKLLENKGV